MKKLSFIFTVVALFSVLFISAQEVEHNGKIYKVKGNKIYYEGVDVTSQLTYEDVMAIKNRNAEVVLAEKKLKEAEKAQKKAEAQARKANKAQKKAEKEQKKAEKAIKKKEQAQKRYEKSVSTYEKNLRKYEKLKGKGKLSPLDEEKWLKKLEKNKETIEKNKSKI